MTSKSSQPSIHKHLLKIHVLGSVACLLIACSAIYFASKSIANQRGHYFNAQHLLANAKSDLNESLTQRMLLTTRVQHLKKEVESQLDLVPVRMLNSRTAQIVELAESVGVRIDSLQPLEKITNNQVPVQPLEIRAKSSASELYKLLGEMNELMPDIHIQSIDILNVSKEISDVQITILLYWFVSPADKT
ncbi:MAG: hypothetical protein P1U42_02095 [Phycisphaerales bacterium]|nr:hypothetical protein [Phycisphaerales bacterium]